MMARALNHLFPVVCLGGEVPPSGEVEEDLAWDGEEEEEDVILAENEDDEQREMDNVVGVLQGLLMDEGFVAMQDQFFAQHAGQPVKHHMYSILATSLWHLIKCVCISYSIDCVSTRGILA
jgi:hypothetical protein